MSKKRPSSEAEARWRANYRYQRTSTLTAVGLIADLLAEPEG